VEKHMLKNYSKILLTPWERFSFVSARPFFKSTHVFLLWSDNSGSYREITARKEESLIEAPREIGKY